MRNLRFLVRVGSLAALATPVFLVGPTMPTAAAAVTDNHGGVVTNYGPGVDAPRSIASGPDGALWFTNGDRSIGRITTSGVITVYRSDDIQGPQAIVAGPDGAMWFTNDRDDSIGRITTSGVVTDYKAPESTNRRASPLVPTGRCGSPTRQQLDREDQRHRRGHELHRTRDR